MPMLNDGTWQCPNCLQTGNVPGGEHDCHPNAMERLLAKARVIGVEDDVAAIIQRVQELTAAMERDAIATTRLATQVYALREALSSIALHGLEPSRRIARAALDATTPEA